MFDRLAWRRECYERYLLLDDEADELDDTQEAAYRADAEDPSRIDDDDTSLISPDAAVTAEDHDIHHAQDRSQRTGPARGICLALRT
jgi:hypothetical protein